MASRSLKRRQGTQKKSPAKGAVAIVSVLAVSFVAIFFGLVTLALSWIQDLPDYKDAGALNTSATSVVYASDGQTVLAEFQLENRDPVEMDAISQYVKDCTVATEDERFYSHSGVDFYGTARSIVNNILGGSREGGSTITQQLVRNTILSDEANDISFKRKLREMYIASEIERIYSKDEILLMYLNTINYGSGAYGIQAASQRYFSKDASDLTLSEAATLVGIPQSPTYNNPIDNPDGCFARRNIVLDRMLSNNYITPEEAATAKQQQIVLRLTEPSTSGILDYPYFTSFVRNQLLNEDGKYAYSSADLFKGGYEIITTLDIEQQADAEIAAEEKERQVGSAFEVAMCAIEPDTGYITSMIGGKDYSASQINMATGEGSSGRQCGSTFKAFTLVAAINEGIDPSTYIDAGYSVKLEGTDKMVYNAGKASYGYIPISRAFALSSNTAFTRLIMSVGVDKVKAMAQTLGIKSPIQDAAGITLGIDSVTPLEMASAYATIANGGTYYEPECILQIKDRNGNVVIDNSHPEGTRVISEEVAYAAVDVMKGVITGGTGTAASLSDGREAAGKTGTTDDEKDSWFVGFTPQLCAAFWLGDPSPNYADAKVVKTSVTSAFSSFMNKALAGKEVAKFKEAAAPSYIESYSDSENHVGSYSGGSGYGSGYRNYGNYGNSSGNSGASSSQSDQSGQGASNETSGGDAPADSGASDTPSNVPTNDGNVVEEVVPSQGGASGTTG